MARFAAIRIIFAAIQSVEASYLALANEWDCCATGVGELGTMLGNTVATALFGWVKAVASCNLLGLPDHRA
ncbi:MAG: hypothetical protein WB696_17075 [Chthoniobacterales bacterium]|jgi:hypothetical protein